MWFLFSLLAAFLWGIAYFFDEHVYRHISVLTSLALTFLIGGVVFGLVAYFAGYLKKDIGTIFGADHRTLLMMLVVLGATLAAELCIGLSISNKNATLAGLIEITYPLFIALIGFLLIRENNLNIPTAFAALLIFTGVGVIYFFNR